jgi:hypothetical protein
MELLQSLYPELDVYTLDHRGTGYSRYPQVFPDQADGVVLEGAAVPDITFITTDADSNRVGHDILDLCAQDTDCTSRLGGDPWAFLDEALQQQRRSGACQEVTLSADHFRAVALADHYDQPGEHFVSFPFGAPLRPALSIFGSGRQRRHTAPIPCVRVARSMLL